MGEFLAEKESPCLLEVLLNGEKSKIVITEDSDKYSVEYIREYVQTEDQYRDISPVFIHGGKEEPIKRKEECYQERVADHGERE